MCEVINEVKKKEKELEEIIEMLPKPLLEKIVVQDEQGKIKEIFAIRILEGNPTIRRIAELLYNRVYEHTVHKVSIVTAYATSQGIYVRLLIDGTYESFYVQEKFSNLINKYIDMIKQQESELQEITKIVEEMTKKLKQLTR